MEEKEGKGGLALKGYDAAYKFARGIYEKYPKVFKTIALFGSYSKGNETEKSDIDIMLIMDDVVNKLDEKTLGFIYADTDELVKKEKSIPLHINFVTLTAFWRGVLAADPVSVNVLRYGVPLIDTGYFEPLQALLEKGEIRPTEESIYASMARSELYSNSARLRLAGAVTDIYWSVVNSAQSVIMKNGEVPPSPETLKGMLESLLRMKVINEEDLKTFEEIYDIGRKILHGDKVALSGSEVESIILKGTRFNEKMDKLLR
ncbi:nucleotidyltransferase domain-containing protein [Candidatus Parvarchaeota archaeon]|nr:nucleotidyltransferase domain-containing protein [Candidatus Parvarchaeota archaeon]